MIQQIHKITEIETNRKFRLENDYDIYIITIPNEFLIMTPNQLWLLSHQITAFGHGFGLDNGHTIPIDKCEPYQYKYERKAKVYRVDPSVQQNNLKSFSKEIKKNVEELKKNIEILLIKHSSLQESLDIGTPSSTLGVIQKAIGSSEVGKLIFKKSELSLRQTFFETEKKIYLKYIDLLELTGILLSYQDQDLLLSKIAR